MNFATRIQRMNKKRSLVIIWSIAAVSWLAIAVSLMLSVEGTMLVAVVTTTAVITEIAFWLTAALLGIAMVDARKAVWAKVLNLFRLSKA